MTTNPSAEAEAEMLIQCRKEIGDSQSWHFDCNSGRHDPDCPARFRPAVTSALQALRDRVGELEKPIDVLLDCPNCHLRHVDEPDERTAGWVNPEHRTHLCHGCGHKWRPCDRSTNGVAAIKTAGKADDPPVDPQARITALEAEVQTLREALEPFIKHYELWMDGYPDEDESLIHSKHTFGDLRKARAAWTKGKTE